MHSPFVFDLITNVIKEKAIYYDFERIESKGNKIGRGKYSGERAEVVSFTFSVGRIFFLPERAVCRGAVAVGFHVPGGCFETDGVAERGMCIFGGRVHGTGETGRFERS